MSTTRKRSANTKQYSVVVVVIKKDDSVLATTTSQFTMTTMEMLTCSTTLVHQHQHSIAGLNNSNKAIDRCGFENTSVVYVPGEVRTPPVLRKKNKSRHGGVAPKKTHRITGMR